MIPFIRPVDPLLDRPSNLKEAIDWILRVTGKDGQATGSQNGTQELASAVTKLLDDVESSSHDVHKTLSDIKEALNGSGAKGIINALGEGLKKFRDGIKSNDEYVYQVLNSNSLTDSINAAKIFFGCVPLCFYGLSYLYWRCSEQGGWKDMFPLGDYVKGYALSDFMKSAGYDPDTDLATHKSGAAIHGALTGTQGFDEFKTASANSFTTFLKNVNSSLMQESSSTPDTFQKHPLSALFLCSTSYFQHHRSNNPNPSRNPPSTIRQMLYWLSGLAITPQFGELLDTFSSIIGADFQVAVSGSHKQNEKLSSDDLAGHLITSCISSPWVLGTIQGPGETDSPLLYNIYSNSEFVYPSSGTGLFNVLSIYTYALQFQLYFLYTQCYNTYNLGCGWNQCQYGSGINTNYNTTVPSHICEGFKCNGDPGQCNHKNGSSRCYHNDRSKGCGKSTDSASPLQAFLTDNLKGFHVSSKPSADFTHHLDNHPPGSMCHVPMGFAGKLRPKARKGNYISMALQSYCGYSTSPLRQLSEKLGCLTKRTPRTLGDLFGFLWHLTGQVFNKPEIIENFKSAINQKPSSLEGFLETLKVALTPSPPPEPASNPSGIEKALLTMFPAIPFLYQLFTVKQDEFLPVTLFNLAQHCHKVEKSDRSVTVVHKSASGSSVISGHQCSDSPNDLWSLYQPVGPAPMPGQKDTQANCREKNCGGYLYSLTHSDGATYAPAHASAYLSWVSYLVDDLATGLQEVFTQFKILKCTGCSGCSSGSHGNTDSHYCPSVVDCAGVLPLLYRHGFQFHEAYLLKGMKWDYSADKWTKDAATARSCQKFSQQLSNVLAENAPLHNLLLAIDEFLYYVRFRFMSLVSSFWLCSMTILLYFIFYGIDVLHVKSHVHLPSSHGIPPIGLLTTGKAPALTKLTYYMP
ncbi:variant erythrocyte surface antigen-1 family protein [Babesia caballi]|uniref:Variant erythrocyte surface antigen-1 family protein n=1 Tax=Babesia caballi TaxID=5871 RepID=A0AAV4LPQ3_BABCB|nr:variant erythrocyte surface antigen-1 family protein [Babesia caballi]